MEQHQEQKVKQHLEFELGYDYVEVEFLLQEVEKSPKVEEKKQKLSEKYELSPKVSFRELWKDRRQRQKSWVVVNHPVREESVMESRLSK